MYGKGISKTGELGVLAVKLGFIQKSGAWFSRGDIRLGQGRDNTKTYLDEHPNLYAEIEKEVRENASQLYAGKGKAAGKKAASIDEAPEKAAPAAPAAEAPAPAPARPAKADIDIMVED